MGVKSCAFSFTIMGCKICSKAKSKQAACDVCRIVDGNFDIKTVRYCSMCKAWICDACRPKYTKRAIAALKRATA